MSLKFQSQSIKTFGHHFSSKMTNQKFQNQSKKGYLQIDFAIAIFLLFLLLMAIYPFYSSKLHSYDLKQSSLLLSGTSNDICKLLVSSPGIPNNWQTNLSSLNQVGLLKSNTNYLDSSKIKVLNSTNYGKIVDSFGGSLLYNILITKVLDGSKIKDFGSAPTNYATGKSISSCYAIYNNTTPVKVQVEVWQ